MALRDETLEQIFKSRSQPAPPAPKPTADAEEDGGTPDFSKPYRAFGHPRAQPLRSLWIYFNAAERRKYGKKKMQIQYEHLDSDDPESEGFAEDGKSFSFVVAGARRALRITVHGRDLEKQGYDPFTSHRLPWMRSFDKERDFGQVEGPVITSFVIEPVEEEEPAAQPQRASG